MDEVKINICPNNHHFLESICPYCRQKPESKVIYNEGDCIKCGEVCLAGLYCCHSPEPIKINHKKD